MMKRLLAMILALVCMCSFAGAESVTAFTPAVKSEETAPAVSDLFTESTLITAAGTVAPEKTADIAVITFSLEGRGETVAEANVEMTQNLNMVLTALKEQGVASEQIRRTRYDVSADIQYHNTKLTDDQVINGYIVQMTLSARILDLNSVGKVIDAAMLSGAQTSPDLLYECSNEAEAYYAALAKAVRQAIDKAGLMAEGCGMKLQELVSIVEVSSQQDEYAVVEVTYAAR